MGAGLPAPSGYPPLPSAQLETESATPPGHHSEMSFGARPAHSGSDFSSPEAGRAARVSPCGCKGGNRIENPVRTTSRQRSPRPAPDPGPAMTAPTRWPPWMAASPPRHPHPIRIQGVPASRCWLNDLPHTSLDSDQNPPLFPQRGFMTRQKQINRFLRYGARTHHR